MSKTAHFLCLGALALSGCSSLPQRGPDPRVQQLERRIVELQQQAAVSQVELERLRHEVTRLEGELAAHEAEQAARQAPTIPVPQTGSIAEAPLVQQPLDEQSLEEEDLGEEDFGSAAPPAQNPVPGAGDASNTGPPTAQQQLYSAVPPLETAGEDLQGLYDRGFELFQQRSYEQAESLFRRVLTMGPSSDLGDNALFWIGESRYARGDLDGALEAFSSTVERYPKGNKVPDALLKAGRTLEAQGDAPAAIETYREVAQRFPNTAAASLARERLAVIAPQ